jgi:transcriptional regulator with XRE-family HTH domain
MTANDVRRLRERLGWTYQQMADYLGLRHRSQALHLESGRSAVRGSKLRLLEVLAEAAGAEKKSKKSARPR